MSEHRYVDSPRALAEVIAEARAQPLAAVDTEGASFHRYVDRVYLVQLSTRQWTAILDPLALPDLSPLGELLADAAVEKVFHDADYDLRTLDRDYGFRARHLFDTRVAAQLVGEPAIGLAALVQKYLGITLAKTHQRADWSQRPLPPAMLAYAAADTRHLPALRDALQERARQLGRLAWIDEECIRVEALRWSGEGAPGTAEAYLRIKGARTLTPRQLAALRELVAWRETVAAQQDKALFRIIGNESLVALSQALPRSLDTLDQVGALPSSLARRHGPALLQAVGRALDIPEHDLPARERGTRLARDPDLEVLTERLKVARNAVAQRLQIDPGVLCGKGTLEMIARVRPSDRSALAAIEGVRRWQVEVMGDSLLQALH